MPTTAYNPLAPIPYEGYQGPEPTAPAPSPLPTEAPQINGAVRTGGAIATAADGIMRGIMAGRAYGAARQAMQLKAKNDNLMAAYNQSAKNLYNMHISGVDQDSPEYKSAQQAVIGSWDSYMDFMGQHVEQPKKRGKQQETPLMDRLRSQDPMEQSAAWYQVAKQAGPPIKYQIAMAEANGVDPARSAMREYNALANKPSLSDDEKKRFTQVTTFLEERGFLKRPPAISSRWVQGKQVLTSELPQGAMQAAYDSAGNIIPGSAIDKREVDPHKAWYPMVRGDQTVYLPYDPTLQLKTTAQPGTGLPEQANYNPIAGTLDVNHPQGMAPIKNEYRTITTTDENQNPVQKIVPVQPGYRAPAALPPTPGAPGQPVLHPRTEVPPLVAAPTPTMPSAMPPATPPASGAAPQPGAAPAVVAPQTTPGVPPTPTVVTPPPATPEQATPTPPKRGESQYAAPLHKQTARIARDSGVPGGGLTFEKYSKDNQAKFNAVRAQELTINGKEGSTTDIGLRRSAENVMNSKDPDIQKNIAVAMKALDTYAKGSLSAHTDGDYGFVQYLRDSWSSVPALQTAFGALDQSPEGKQYLDNFFRAWTNAATIRALQGTTGRPTQSMYAMLVNELPMIGVNVSNMADVHRKIDMLQDDVDTAAETLPGSAKTSLSRMKTQRTVSPSNSTQKHNTMDQEIMNLLHQR